MSGDSKSKTEAAEREEERLAISTASARVVQSLDSLTRTERSHLTADEERDLVTATNALERVYCSLEQRLSR